MWFAAHLFFVITGLHAGSDPTNVDQIARAELLVVFARRMNLPEEQMAIIRKHWEDGKPIVGIRTASHPFNGADNETFDRKVLGGHYKGHFGGEPVRRRAKSINSNCRRAKVATASDIKSLVLLEAAAP